MKEALLIYENLLGSLLAQHEGPGAFEAAGDLDKRYLFEMIQVTVKCFGTNDLEWFCAAETVLNTMFNLKSRMAHEYARLYISQLQAIIDKLHSERNKKLSEVHFAQLFFVVGHTAIKMLTFIETLESDLKKAISGGKKGGPNGQNADDENEELA